MSAPLRQLAAWCVACAIGCVADVGDPGSRRDALIYGDDTRVEVSELAEEAPAIARVASRAVGALVDLRAVHREGADVWLEGPTLSERVAESAGAPLCDGVPFATQRSIARCGGVLVGPRHWLTAAHCVPTQRFCDEAAVVFGLHLDGSGELAFRGERDVYRCVAIDAATHLRDLVVLRLDRAVDEARELVRPHVGPWPEEGAPLAVLSHGLGLPLKADLAARAGPAHPRARDAFFFAADVHAGSSGGAVLDPSGALLGLVSRGPGDDLVSGVCVGLRRVDALAPPLEVATDARPTLFQLCDALGSEAPALCADAEAWCPGCVLPPSSGCSAGATSAGAAGLAPSLLVLVITRRGPRSRRRRDRRIVAAWRTSSSTSSVRRGCCCSGASRRT